MAAPITLYGPNGKPIDRRLLNYPRGNQLIASATQTKDRKTTPLLDYDVHRSVSGLGRRTLLSVGRRLYYDSHAIRGAVKERAEYASSTFLPQYYGRNPAWGVRAEAWLENHDRICDVAGQPYNMRLYRRNLLISLDRDGDMLTVLVDAGNGFPMIQCIPGHRVGWKEETAIARVRLYQDSLWIDGRQVATKAQQWLRLTFGRELFEDPIEFDARIIDGVIITDTNTPIAYRVNTSQETYRFDSYVDVSARDSFLSFIPEFNGQLRGFSQLGITALPLIDISESDNLELISQKVGAAISLIEKNAEGEAPPGDSDGFPVASAGTSSESDYAEEFATDSGAMIRYLRSGDPNTSIETMKFDRPSANQQNFRNAKLRDAFAGIDWSIDFSLDPTKVGGAQSRVLVDKLNRNLQALRDLALTPACVRIDGWRVAKAIKIGSLSFDPDWWMWSHQGPARITADAKYDSDVDAQEISRGIKTRRRAIANRGEYIDDVDAEIERDGEMRWAVAKRIADKFNIDIVAAYNSLWNPSPNGLASWMDSNIDAPPSGTEGDKQK
jgi:hypothetical protein